MRIGIRFLFLPVFFIPSFFAVAQQRESSFQQQWKIIDSLMTKQDLTKTALAKVNQLYNKAQQQKNSEEILKALIYRYSLEDRVNTDDPAHKIKTIQTETTKTTDAVQRAILHSLLARQYLQYYLDHRWNLLNRKNTAGIEKDDIATWSPQDFITTITRHFLESLKPAAQLKTKRTSAYSAIISKGSAPELRPTVFDLLAHAALDFLKSAESLNASAAINTFIDDTAALAPLNRFIHHSFHQSDSTGSKALALDLSKQLLNFHFDDPDKNALVDADIERIHWAYTETTSAQKEQLYANALQYIITHYADAAASAGAWYALARREADNAAQYQPFGDTTHRSEYKKAVQLAREALAKFPSGIYTASLKNLIAEIEQKQLSTELEKISLPYKPILANIRYRNSDSFFVRIFQLSPADALLTNFSGSSINWQQLNMRKPVQTFAEHLPGSEDHQQHTSAFKIDALAPGRYALYVSNGSMFSDSLDNLSLQFFQVSSLSYLQQGKNFFVLNRETGQPVNNAEILFLHQEHNQKGDWKYVQTASRKTDKNGQASFNTSDGSWKYIFQVPGDTLLLDNDEYVFNNNARGKENASIPEQQSNRIFFFLDRSIYRPGQTIYFKGIGVTREKATGLSKLITAAGTNRVYLKDANRKTIDSLKFELNEYGSFHGKFMLPQNVLTGNFSLETKGFNQSNSYFSVEEYKRPAFSVIINKPKSGYRLNDTITVTGSVKAYSGNAIDHAKVIYEVTRNTRFIVDPWTYRRINPMMPAKNIAHGETITDAQGNFKVTFIANAKDVSDTNNTPLFNFNVNANVTDANGETRSGSISIATGFQSLLLSVSAPVVTEKDSIQKIKISTTNLSNEKEASLVHVKISELQTPAFPIRQRVLSRPDQFLLNKELFHHYFPEDEYDDESSVASWPVTKEVQQITINTAKQDVMELPAGALPAGSYRIEAETTDRSGRLVKQRTFMHVIDPKNNLLAYPAISLDTKNMMTAQPGQQISFPTASAVPDRFVIRQTGRDTSGYFTFKQQHAGFDTISYVTTEADRGGTAIQEFFVYHNRAYNRQYRIDVPWTNKRLQVTYASYRDHTEPGNKETWTITVDGEKGNGKASELLTAMYDASLDQFKPHSWSVPDIWPGYIPRNPFRWDHSFSTGEATYINAPQHLWLTGSYMYDRFILDAEEFWDADQLQVPHDPRFPGALQDQQTEYTMRSYMRVMPRAAGRLMAYQKMEETAASSDALSTVHILGNAVDAAAGMLYVIDGKTAANADNIDPKDIISADVLKGEDAVKLYGSQAANGVVIITTRQGAAPVQVRKNMNETAFFFPQLYADSSGKFSFSFTMPEALTQWKWITLAHTQDLAFGMNTATIITQKKLMVQPNAPRFMREGDNVEFSGKIVNMTDKELSGQATLELIDAATGTSVDGWFQNVFPSQYFTMEAGQSMAVKFPVQVPFSFNRALTWRMTARTKETSDGEENTLPVLPNRMLVTESLPIYLQHDTTQHFSFDKLLHNNSESLTTESLTVEFTSNPVWYAVQALPYLIEYPYECSEQTFNRFYAAALASFILNKQPKLKQVFELWKADSTALLSNLQKNEDLKQALLQETPWVLQAESEAQQKKNLALLFDLGKLSSQADQFIRELEQQQLPNGSFSWFKGGNADRYITNYILTGIGKLKRIGAITPDIALRIRGILSRAIRYMDAQIDKDYQQLLKSKADLSKQQAGAMQIEYLYMRSFFGDLAQNENTAYQYYYTQAKQFWIKQNNYHKALTGIVALRNREEAFARNTIAPALLENTSSDNRMGMYWKTTHTNWWYQSPIEYQSMMIAFFAELNQGNKDTKMLRDINAMKTWLLLNKQTNNWGTTVATADACYALLLQGSNWLNEDKKITIQLGKTQLTNTAQPTEAGTGYFKKRIDGRLVTPEMGNITVSTSGSSSPVVSSPSWGSIHWQYFENLDKLSSATGPLSIVKKLFVEKNTDNGKLLLAVNDGDELKPGDKLVVRLELRSDRDMDYLHLKDMRAASTEPVNALSGYKWQDGLGYYESTRDASTSFFIDHLNKGIYVFEYPLFVTHAGIFSVGVASIQSMYAPEFNSHSSGLKIRVAAQ